jgi:dethiobiotin synthetase
MKGYVITGIGTGIGKTLISTIFTQALQADYYKPIQAGGLRNSDSKFVKSHLRNNKSYVHPEQYRLYTPESPHHAAAKEGVQIKARELTLPQTTNTLIVEPAGGLMVPLNDDELYIDWIASLNFPVILVSDIYLGSINHTLLSIEALRNRNIEIKGLVFNHAPKQSTEYIITHRTKLPVLLSVRKQNKVTIHTIMYYARILKENCERLKIAL